MMVKVRFNKYHGKWEIYYHHNGKQHVGYSGSYTDANRMAMAAQRVVDKL